MSTAELIRGPYQWEPQGNTIIGNSTRCLWATEAGGYIVTSSVHIPMYGLIDVQETMAFPADENGEITDFGELSCVGHGQHREAIEAAGYTIKENK